LPSSGPHSNGFSLIRKILEVSAADVAAPVQGTALIDRLMAPTRIYVKPLLKLMAEIGVHGLAHITGAALSIMCRGCYRRDWKQCSNAAPGAGIRYLTGCRARAASPTRKCIACSIAASA